MGIQLHRLAKPLCRTVLRNPAGAMLSQSVQLCPLTGKLQFLGVTRVDSTSLSTFASDYVLFKAYVESTPVRMPSTVTMWYWTLQLSRPAVLNLTVAIPKSPA